MTNMPKDKTPREVKIIESAEDGGFVAVYGTFSGIGTTKEDAYRELCVALSLATEVFEDELAAERQNRCPQCEAGNKPWWDYAWMHTINGTNIDCRGRYPDPMTPHGKDFYEEITEQIMKIASLEAELAEAKRLLQIETQMVNSLHNYDGDAANLLRRYDIDNRSLTAENEKMKQELENLRDKS